MYKAIIRYILFVIPNVISDALAFLLAPIAALFYSVDSGGREQISKWWQWITTHDTPVDTYIVAKGYAKDKQWLLSKYTHEEILNSKYLRWVGRVLWIWRNPSYQVGHWLGYDQTGVALTKYSESEDTWDTGNPSYAYWTAINNNYQRAFLWERQVYFYKNRCLEMQFGWKLYRNDPDQRCMIAFRITPFKKYGG